MSVFQKSGMPPSDIWWLDRSARLTRESQQRWFNVGAATMTDAVARWASNGLLLIDGTVQPANPQLAGQWLATIKRVCASGSGQLFMLARNPKLQSVGLIASDQSGQVGLRLQRETLYDAYALGAFAGLHELTTRESQVLQLMCEGQAPTSIAGELETAVSTVRSQIKAVFRKTGLASTREVLVAIATLPDMQPLQTKPGAQRQPPLSTDHQATQPDEPRRLENSENKRSQWRSPAQRL